MLTKPKRREKAVQAVANGQDRPFVSPHADNPKSGCFWCPLFPMSRDFQPIGYMRDAVKLLAKLKEPHVVRNRRISEPSWTTVDMLIVGEAARIEEDKTGSPFAGRPGELITSVLTEVVKVPLKRIGWSNIVRCRPPLNREPNRTEIQCCAYELVREIQARQPKVIVATGNASLEFLTGHKGITALCGKVLQCTRPEFPELSVVGCVHPAYVLRMDHWLDKFAEALETAGDVVAGTYKPLLGAGEYRTITDIDEAVAYLDGLVAAGKKFAVDTETGSLSCFQSQFPHLLCLSFSNREGEGVTIPYDHPESPWKGDCPAKRKLKAALRRVLGSKVPKVGQNEKFDRQHIFHELGIWMTDILDTMNRHLTVDETRGTHGLDKLAHQYTGMGGYEMPLEWYRKANRESNPDRGGSYANIPGEILFPYAGMDADVTLRVDNAMIQEKEYADNPKLQRLAEEFFPRLSDTLARMEYDGAQVDMGVIREMETQLQAEQRDLADKVLSDPKVQQYSQSRLSAAIAAAKAKAAVPTKNGRARKFTMPTFEFNPDSDAQLRSVFFGLYGRMPVELTDSGLKVLAARYARLLKKDPMLEFHKVIKQAVKAGQWEHFSVKADVLHEYSRQKVALADHVLAYRKVSKLLGTYIQPMGQRLDPQDRVHGSFWIGGTTTGRLCVAFDTVLETDQGKFCISDICLQKVQNLRIRTHYGRYRKIIDCFYKGREEMYRVRLDNGAYIDCTAGHRVWTPSGWKHVSDLQEGEAVYSTYGVVDTVSSQESGAVKGAAVHYIGGSRLSSEGQGYADARSAERQGSKSAGVHSAEIYHKGGGAGRVQRGQEHSWPTANVASIEPLGVKGVWDIGVEEDESYAAQGLIHHNSSAEPNLQNIPPAAKYAYTSRFGDSGVILQGDYSQIELRVAASWFNVPQMIKAYLNEEDLHLLTAIDISKLSKDEFMALPDAERKEWRGRAKRVNFGVLYGGGPPALQSTLRKDGIFLTVDECKDLIRTYFAKRPALRKGIEKLEALVKRVGFLESFTGRRRRIPEVQSVHEALVQRALRQSINFPIQSGAGDMTLMSLVLIHELMRAEGFESKPVLTVHDSIVFDCHVDEVLAVATLAKDVMENIQDLSDHILTGIDWSWLRVPVKAEFEAGINWGTGVSFDPVAVQANEPVDEPLYDEKGKMARSPVTIEELWDAMETKYAKWVEEKAAKKVA